MQPTPLISVVIPAFNSGRFIETAICSVLDQSYRNFELIMVDDGSVDNTDEIMQKYKDKGTVIRHERNRGGNVARNNGIKACNGDLIAFLDSDDRWHRDKLKIYVDAFNTHNGPLFAVSDFNRFEWESGQYYAHSNSQIHPSMYEVIGNMFYQGIKAFVVPRQDMLRLLLGGYPPFSSAIMVKRELFELVGTWDETLKRNQDFDFSLRCARATDFIYIDERLTDIGRHDSNVSFDIEKQRDGDINVMKRHLGSDQYTADQKQQIGHFIGKRLSGQAYMLRHTGRLREAQKKYLQALRYPGMLRHAAIRLLYTFLLSLRHPVRTYFGTRNGY